MFETFKIRKNDIVFYAVYKIERGLKL